MARADGFLQASSRSPDWKKSKHDKEAGFLGGDPLFFVRIQGKPQDLPSDPEKWADMPFFRPPDHVFSISFFVL
jgi:hypothetical protein